MQVDIEAEFKPTHDEHARQRFVSMLRKHAIINMTAALHDHYENEVLPKLQKQSREPQGWRDIDSAMQDDAMFRFYSTTRYNAQEMCYQSVQPTIERNIEHANATARAIADNPDAGGTLQLDPALPIPPYVSQLDVHLAPGYTHQEHVEDDVAQGAVVALGGKVFTGQHPYRKSYGTVAESVSYFVKRKFSSMRPVRVLDLGTCSGKNLLPFAATFPGIELYGIDVGAPVLRYGHACAEHEGIAAHFSQQNAEHTNFEDGFFDIITSSFFLHEIPVASTQRVMSECMRLLAPGGVMIHMELPNEAAVSDYENFFWNWDTKNNNEPFYTRFRSQDFFALCAEAGFAADATFARTIPDFASSGVEVANACIDGDRETPPHGRGGWFVFGAQKSA
jgi:ubiquinone/menaquinone biosynthesis C-methylase UbiE